ncbi:MAG: potassium channel family protein [Zhongshania sp.]|uniref:potassium channel family protein n=1 Tax=Zhongshania sp. TaxID=1971902 RepID=UPI00262016E8|nr:potassium channel family protein [Zhongshania sp.]MDF1693532.1 potassium channel family protein [Zhongshania sp.]
MIYVFLINTIVVATSVVVHYEFLYRITLYIPKMKIKHRYRIVFGVFGALIAHALEIWIFAVTYYFMNHTAGWGSLEGNFNGSLMDCGYFSFTVFTTLGFGDIQPNGSLRYLTGIESLTGLVLITWTASFLYVEMQRYWGSDKNMSKRQ